MWFGGGIAEGLEVSDYNGDNFLLRNVFDLSFFILINVVLLNIIFGLIIDAFAELRDESNEKSKLYNIQILTLIFSQFLQIILQSVSQQT